MQGYSCLFLNRRYVCDILLPDLCIIQYLCDSGEIDPAYCFHRLFSFCMREYSSLLLVLSKWKILHADINTTFCIIK